MCVMRGQFMEFVWPVAWAQANISLEMQWKYYTFYPVHFLNSLDLKLPEYKLLLVVARLLRNCNKYYSIFIRNWKVVQLTFFKVHALVGIKISILSGGTFVIGGRICCVLIFIFNPLIFSNKWIYWIGLRGLVTRAGVSEASCF